MLLDSISVLGQERETHLPKIIPCFVGWSDVPTHSIEIEDISISRSPIADLLPVLEFSQLPLESIQDPDSDDLLIGIGDHGNDYLDGGHGKDLLIGGSGEDEFLLRPDSGHDLIQDFKQHDDKTLAVLLDVDASSVTAVDFLSLAFDNDGLSRDIIIDEMPTIVDTMIDGTPEADRLTGDEQSNGITGLAGNDILTGRGGFDVLSGNEGNDILLGGRGDDRLSGGDGQDILRGGKGNDNLKGDDGDDRLRGGRGKDFLRGGSGHDRLFGGQGRDVFVLQPGQGVDRIQDFEDGKDKLGLDAVTQFDDLHITQVGSNTVISNESDRIAILVGIDADTITAHDFGQVIIAL